MPANSFGNLFRITSFGESHGKALGVVIDGCPAGVEFDQDLLSKMLERRRPGHGVNVSQRREADEGEILSGVFEGKTLGTPIAIVVKNKDANSSEYNNIKDSPRSGHADDVWRDKFGHSDHRGGGRSSGRETVARVMAGAVAQMFLRQSYPELSFQDRLTKVGPLSLDEAGTHPELDGLLTEAKEQGLSYGGEVELTLSGVPKSLGQPVFNKLKSDLAAAVMSIGATTSFELGSGSDSATAEGTEFHKDPQSEKYGGIRGGISTGEDVNFKVCFKPTSSVLDIAKKGRHDPCVAIRAAVVVEAMASLVLADHALWQRLSRI